VSHKNYADIGRLRDISNARELDNRSFKARLESMDTDLEANQRRTQHLMEVKEQKDQDISSVN
jgi:hypothetical protein